MLRYLFYKILKRYKLDSLRKYEDTFLVNAHTYPNYLNNNNENIKRIVYCFWTGNSEMSDNRRQSLENLKNNLEVNFELISPQNLNQYIKEEFPLHRAYPYLSLVHRSDYLRCYFMHHYGGGYTDLKQSRSSWLSLFEKLEESNCWILGYREIGKKGVASAPGILGDDLKKYWHVLLGNCAYICRPYTFFTYDWYNELHKRLDIYFDDLKKNPGNILGDNEGYPIPWTNILGDIFHPLCLKYNDKILYSDKIRPILKRYR